jgi:arsenate reductase
MALTLYGIPNCDTVRKARKMLEVEGIDYQFHDFKKQGLTAQTVQGWLAHQTLDILLNRRGTSWRKLSDAEKAMTDEAQLVALMVANPSLVKRPVCVAGDMVTVGFTEEVQAKLKAL